MRKTLRDDIVFSLKSSFISMSPTLISVFKLFDKTLSKTDKIELLYFIFLMWIIGSVLVSAFIFYYINRVTPKRIKKVLNHKEFQVLDFKVNENKLEGIYRNFYCKIFYETFSQNPMIKGSALSTALSFKLSRLELETLRKTNNWAILLWYEDAVVLSLPADFRLPTAKLLIKLDKLIDLLEANKVKTNDFEINK